MYKIRQYRSLVVPVVMVVLSALWFIFEPTFEPAITFVGSSTASIVTLNQIKNDWVQRTENHIYSFGFRGIASKDIDGCVEEAINLDPGITRWKLHHDDGEFKTLLLESIKKIDPQHLISAAKNNKCKPYTVILDSEIIWETKAI